MLSELARNIIVSLSFFALGVVTFLAAKNFIKGFKTKGHQRRLNFAYAAARFGFVIVLALMTEAVFQAPGVPVNWRTNLYIVGLALASFGYLGIAYENRRTDV